MNIGFYPNHIIILPNEYKILINIWNNFNGIFP